MGEKRGISNPICLFIKTYGTPILNSNDFQISMDKHFQVNYQLKSPLSPQPPYPHCVEKGGETHFRAGFSPRSNFLGRGLGVG